MSTYLKPFLYFVLVWMAAGCQLEDPTLPVAAGSASATDCTAPCTVQFTDASTGRGLYAWNYRWDFGDGTSSTEKNPSHTYTQTGTHQVTLSLSGKYGNATDSSLTVTVKGKGPVAGFTFTGGNCTAPCEVVFTNQSENATTYLWTFGDGTSSTQQNPVKTYTSAGKYKVELTASNAQGTHLKSDSVTILGPELVANFGVELDNSRTDSTKVKFINMSTNATGYQWDFGDKITSTLKDPIHWYKRLSGKDTSYAVKLKAIGIGESFKEKTMSLVIQKPE
ncbi:PKD domain-containing protein [Salmonirosea aquatica]|uniref:PKD domain-containing protein n=1 Tax=Salmonirosea aquatica TaxID=2654236 RepID=A0A7C9FZU1_9BACT|nr:PKD domain-containing protein [Cytophagaceae bacterium SJW1-29]